VVGNYLYWRDGLHQNVLTCDRAADIATVTPHIHINITREDSSLCVSDHRRFGRSLRLLVQGSSGPIHSPTHTTSYPRRSLSPVYKDSAFSLQSSVFTTHVTEIMASVSRAKEVTVFVKLIGNYSSY
jgi:hypothetical protein